MAARRERVVMTCMGLASGLQQMQGVMEPIDSRHHGKAPDEIEWSKRSFKRLRERRISLAVATDNAIFTM
jgi:hypothetical protein